MSYPTPFVQQDGSDHQSLAPIRNVGQARMPGTNLGRRRKLDANGNWVEEPSTALFDDIATPENTVDPITLIPKRRRLKTAASPMTAFDSRPVVQSYGTDMYAK